MRAPQPDDALLTGVGAVTALGYGVATNHDAVATGRSAVTDGMARRRRSTRATWRRR